MSPPAPSMAADRVESKTKAEQRECWSGGSELQTGLLFISELGALGLGS